MLRGVSGPLVSSSHTASPAVSSRIACVIISDVVDVNTNRLAPYSTAASSRLSVPVTFTSTNAWRG